MIVSLQVRLIVKVPNGPIRVDEFRFTRLFFFFLSPLLVLGFGLIGGLGPLIFTKTDGEKSFDAISSSLLYKSV